VEPLVASNPAVALEHASRSRIPQLARFIARRAVDAGAVEPVVAALGTSPRTTASLLEGMRDGLAGRFDLSAPPAWGPVFDRLKRSDAPVASLADDVARRFSDTEAARLNLAIVANRAQPIDQRRQALQLLAALRQPALAGELAALVDDPALRLDAIRAIAAFDVETLGRLLVARYSSFSAAEKVEAVQTLASRARYGRMLTEALATNTIPRRDVPPHVARQLRRVVGAKFADIWGPVEANVTEEKAMARYRSLLTDRALAAADLRNGKRIFQRTCSACHKMYGEGGGLGPDLTGSNRANLDYLLFNVLNPSGDVPEGYRMVVVTTRDGRTVSGNVIAETDRQLTLRAVGQDAFIINKTDIQSRDTTPFSMMPSGLFDSLIDREVIDLVAYLRTITPVRVP
jgi:putative heme-binding domain-containing protein